MILVKRDPVVKRAFDHQKLIEARKALKALTAKAEAATPGSRERRALNIQIALLAQTIKRLARKHIYVVK